MASLDLLLDTHLTLWAIEDSPRLSATARTLINDPEHDLYFSAISIWEIAIKHALGKADFRVDPVQARQTLLRNLYREVPLTGDQTFALATLPKLHRDPFDRMLVAQALSEGLTLLTADRTLAKYPGRIVLV